jgi:hypothetical protein
MVTFHRPLACVICVLIFFKSMGALLGLVRVEAASVSEAGRPPVVSGGLMTRLRPAELLTQVIGRASFFAVSIVWHALFFGRRQLVIQGVSP